MKRAFLTKRHWSARALFTNIAESDWQNPGIELKYQNFLMADLFSEYDAVNLYHYLHPRRGKFSSYFVQYLDLWFADERNHADGFFELNRLLFGPSEEQLIDQLKTRTANFDSLEKILSDEFSLLLMFAYDEYVSVKTYKKDTFYSGFGHPLFNTWIKNLIADEAIHFGNAIKILKNSYPAQLSMAENTLQCIAELENSAYQNTFLFDHDGPHFLLEATELGDSIIENILSILSTSRT
jgi:rubrerythrin